MLAFCRNHEIQLTPPRRAGSPWLEASLGSLDGKPSGIEGTGFLRALNIVHTGTDTTHSRDQYRRPGADIHFQSGRSLGGRFRYSALPPTSLPSCFAPSICFTLRGSCDDSILPGSELVRLRWLSPCWRGCHAALRYYELLRVHAHPSIPQPVMPPTPQSLGLHGKETKCEIRCLRVCATARSGWRRQMSCHVSGQNHISHHLFNKTFCYSSTPGGEIPLPE